MMMQPSEIVDRFTVLKIRQEHNISCEQELLLFANEVAQSGVDKKLVNELYEVNKEMWPIHDEIMQCHDMAKVGTLCVHLLKLNGKRAAIKAVIAEKYGGFTELKSYA